MRTPFRPHTLWNQRFNTSVAREGARDLLAAAAHYQSDDERAARLDVTECKYCFYFRRSRIGGAAMTTWYCGLCATRHTASSTNTPRVCQPCGIMHKLCTHCGGDLDMRERRRTWPTPVTDVVLDDDHY